MVRRLAGTVTGEVVIRRPVQVVYSFYRDFTNLPRVLGDVVAVEQVAGTTYRWIVAGPLGSRLPMTVTITDQRVNELIRYQTGGPGPLRGRWELAFAVDAGSGGTRVREQLVVPMGAIGRAVLALIGKFPDREVAANLTRLKQLLETMTEADTPSAAASRPPTAGGPMTSVTVERGHVFTTGGETTLGLDLYRAPQADAPLVLYVHGGGWRSGDKADAGTERLAPLAAYGVTVAIRRLPAGARRDVPRSGARPEGCGPLAARLRAEPGRAHRPARHLGCFGGGVSRLIARADRR